MKVYDIIDGELERSIGTLLYYEKEKSFIMELMNDLDEWTAPLLTTSLVKQGIYTIPKDVSFAWVSGRVIPSGRQNIGAILNRHHLKEYDEMKFLEISKGRCSQDAIHIRPIDELPKYVIERQEKNITQVTPLEGFRLLCFFEDGVTKLIDCSRFSDQYDMDKIISNEGLFQSATVGTGGYSVTFADTMDLPAAPLYDMGDEIPLSCRDFITFLQINVLDTTQSCDFLGCSRQNLLYFVRQQKLRAVKNDVKGNLYLKGDIIRLNW